MSKRFIHGVVIGLVSVCAATALWRFGLLDWLEMPMWDWRVRTLAKPGTATDNIRLILLDQKSLTGARIQLVTGPGRGTGSATNRF